MSIVGGPPPSLARDVDVAPRTITDTRIAPALANMVEPSTRSPPAPWDISKPMSRPCATGLANNPRAKWRSREHEGYKTQECFHRAGPPAPPPLLHFSSAQPIRIAITHSDRTP